MKPHDTLVIWRLDRLGRSLRKLLDLVDYFEKNNIEFVCLKDHIDTSSPWGRCFFVITAAFAELERSTISMRTIAGLESAKAKGRFGGRPPKDPKKIEYALKMYKSGISINDIQKMSSVSSYTLYAYLRKEVYKLYGEGKNISEIAELTNYSEQSIENFLDKVQK